MIDYRKKALRYASCMLFGALPCTLFILLFFRLMADRDAGHRAGGDAFATAQVFLRMMEDARREGCESWHDLQRLLIAPVPKRRRSRRPPAMPRPVDKDTTA